MRPLTDEERRLMRHALGFANGRVAYRNRYATTGRHDLWEGLVAIGAANRHSFEEGKMWWYWVTEAGYHAVVQPGESRQDDLRYDFAN
jgi:hypothetical protein